MRQLIENGHVYAACPPLYKVQKGKKVKYLYTDKELADYDTEGATIQRYKGLGEMNPDQLWETTMNPDTRKLIQITLDDAEAAEETLSVCMGENIQARKEFILSNAG